MGIEPKNYGSVFLFRNGFRIMPFGNTGDDSWGLDYRAQQGKNRFLGTRDLFGRVDVITNNIEELKEVSSRDGGLIETQTSSQLFQLFTVAHRRLERYVAGVLWGGSFVQKEYFRDENEALLQRKELLEADKEYDTPDYIMHSSLGSKIDFVQLIKTLTRDKNIEVLSYNKDLANLFANLSDAEQIKPQFISDLEKIAENTNDDSLLTNVKDIKEYVQKLRKEKEESERKAAQAEQQRLEAERKAQEAEERRKEAERKRAAEAEAKRLAQLQAKEAELKRREEEIKRKEAEQKQKEEEERRKKAEKEKQIESLKVEFYKKASNPDTDALIHHVKNNNSRINDDIDKLIKTIAAQYKGTEYYEFIITTLSNIRKLSQKSLMATDLILNTDLSTSDSQKINLPLFIEGYLKNDVHDNIKCHFSSSVEKFAVIGSKLDLGLILDNFIKNSLDWGAKNFWVTCSNNMGRLIVDIYDDGLGLSNIFLNNPEEIFNFATSGKNDGTGFGMYLIRETLKDFKATIEVSEPIENKGIHFKISFK
jgi:myosin heavy subunit